MVCGRCFSHLAGLCSGRRWCSELCLITHSPVGLPSTHTHTQLLSPTTLLDPLVYKPPQTLPPCPSLPHHSSSRPRLDLPCLIPWASCIKDPRRHVPFSPWRWGGDNALSPGAPAPRRAALCACLSNIINKRTFPPATPG